MIYKCCEYQNKDEVLFNAYLSAVFVRYWNCIKLFANRGGRAFTQIDVYEWLTDSILATINTKLWENPNSSLYGDELAPEKSIKVRLRTHMQGRFQFVNYAKRSGAYNGTTYDLDKMIDDDMECDLPRDESFEDNYVLYNDIKNFVIDAFDNARYMDVFTLDTILNEDIFSENNQGRISSIKVLRHIRKLTDDDLRKISTRYNIIFSRIKACHSYLIKMKQRTLYNYYSKALSNIKNAFRGDI